MLSKYFDLEGYFWVLSSVFIALFDLFLFLLSNCRLCALRGVLFWFGLMTRFVCLRRLSQLFVFFNPIFSTLASSRAMQCMKLRVLVLFSKMAVFLTSLRSVLRSLDLISCLE